MDRITIPWRRVFDLSFRDDELKDEVIANAVKKAVMNKQLVLGGYVPPYRAVALYMGLNRSVLGAAWQRLLVEHKLFDGDKGAGTRLVSELPGRKRRTPAEHKITSIGRKRKFDLETADNNYIGARILNNEMEKSRKSFPELNAKELTKANIPGLITQFRIMINDDISVHYAENEIYYTQGYPTLIHRICMSISLSKKVFVIAGPASDNLTDAVNKSGKELVFIGTDSHGIIMEELESICINTSIAFVLLKSRSLIPGSSQMTAERIDQLLVLQEKYKFVIIEDDRYVDLYVHKSNLLMDRTNRTNAKVLYLRPVTVIDPHLYLIYIMGGPAKLISAVNERFLFDSKLGSVMTGMTLTDVMERQVLVKLKLKMKRALPELNKKARNAFMEAGIWKEPGLSCSESWYFYLEPKYGKLPPNVFELLLNKRHYVLDPAVYLSGPEYSDGVIVSIAGYLDDQSFIPHLLEFNNFFKSIII